MRLGGTQKECCLWVLWEFGKRQCKRQKKWLRANLELVKQSIFLVQKSASSTFTEINFARVWPHRVSLVNDAFRYCHQCCLQSTFCILDSCNTIILISYNKAILCLLFYRSTHQVFLVQLPQKWIGMNQTTVLFRVKHSVVKLEDVTRLTVLAIVMLKSDTI